MDRYQSDADPDPNFHFDADTDPDPDWHQNDAIHKRIILKVLHMLENREHILLLFTATPIYYVMFSHQRQMHHNFEYFWQAFMKDKKINVIGIDNDPDPAKWSGSGSTKLDKDGADLVPEHFRHVRLEFLLLLQRLQDVQ